MSNLEAAPVEVACTASRAAGIEVLHPREVPLGGPRAIRVRRTLPQRQRSLVGAWCFVDHYGPVTSAKMDVPPHPAHRTADGELVVQWGSGAPRQRRRPCHGPARRAEPDDGGSGHLPFRSVGDQIRRSSARCAAVGGAAGLRSRHWARLRSLCARADFVARRGGAGVSRGAGGQPLAGARRLLRCWAPRSTSTRRSAGPRRRPVVRARRAVRRG